MNGPTETTHLSRMTGAQRDRVSAIKRQVETPHERIMYGQPRTVAPTFCDAVLGDGAYMLIVTAVRTAPAYHVMLIDSSWVRQVPKGFRCADGIEVDLDDPERTDLIASVLLDSCGDGDRWHEEHGEDAYAPPGYFHADMGFSWGLEALGPDGPVANKDESAFEPA